MKVGSGEYKIVIERNYFIIERNDSIMERNNSIIERNDFIIVIAKPKILFKQWQLARDIPQAHL
jgi:hypothetical protein